MEPVRFPDIPFYQGWGAPQRSESDIRDLEVVSGALPEGLDGVWFRCGPDRQYPPMLGDDIFIDGEGMAHLFDFADGAVSYRSRWVRSTRFLAQEKARRSLFGRYRNRYTNDPSVDGLSMGTANTNLVWHGGKLLALKEDDLPYELDPVTLQTLRQSDYDGQVRAVSMTAHPKVDWATDELLSFSYQAKGDATRDVVFYAIGPDGKVRREIWFQSPWPACVHDFAVTPRYAIIPFFPLITDLDVVRQGGPYYQYHPDKPTMVAVIPRDGTAADIRWFEGPNTTAGHMLNAFEDGEKVHLDLCLYHGNCFPFFPTPAGGITQPVPPILDRMTFDMEANGAEFGLSNVSRIPCEMPRTDDRYQGLPYRHGFAITGRKPDGSSSVGRVDVATGQWDVWTPGPTSSVQEPQFAPRGPGAAEGDGWLLVLVNRFAENRSDLVVLDAQDLAAGPVAVVKLPIRVRATFHGVWAPRRALETGLYASGAAEAVQ
jgi:carotenoid cleavage dioxygenase-like enzyme